MALELKRRGHSLTIAATPHYRAKVEQLGIAFMPLRPDFDPTSGEMIAKCQDIRRGPEILIRELILPHLQDTYDDLLAAARNADLMIAGELVYPAPLVAEKLNLRWASAILSPTSFLSAYDPSVLTPAPELMCIRKSWLLNRIILTLSAAATKHWWRPVRALRRAEGLGPGRNPLFHDKFAPELVLALFSRLLAQPQRDWPPQTIQPGFVFYDRPHIPDPSDQKLAHFLAAGDAPIVFTQGSTAVHHPGNFYKVSVEAVRHMGHRAIVIGADPDTVPASRNVLALQYAPYSEVFPHAAVIVHQGGSGTTGQAMKAGRPMLIVPFGWDQPDNAARMVRLGSALSLSREAYSDFPAAHALTRLIAEPHFLDRAAFLKKEMQAEEGLSTACNALEQLLSRSH